MTEASSLVRSDLLDIDAVAHGSVSAIELATHGFTPGDVLDFSVNTNPLGPAPAVLAAVQATDWGRYPGDDEMPLRDAIAKRAGVTADQVVLGNGSVELLWWLALAALRAGDQAGIIGPTFGEYARAVRSVGATPVHLADPENASGLRALFLCNPNNPTGQYRSPSDIEHIVETQPRRLVVLDEAYATFVEQPWRSEALLERENVTILRSMTKDQALPGLRLGYMLTTESVAHAVERVRPPWSVNSGALRAGLAAMEPAAEQHLERARCLVAQSRRLLTQGLTRLGFAVQTSQANFVLVKVGNGSAFRGLLLRHGCVVRDCASFGLPEYVRIACRLPAECERLLDLVEHLRQ